MENACYYTFSTISQTLAGAFGFLVAVVLYKMQGMDHELVLLCGRTIHPGSWDGPFDSASMAARNRDWLRVADLMKDLVPRERFDPNTRKQLELEKERLLNKIERVRFLVDGLRYALTATGLVIFISLGLVLFTPVIVKLGWAWPLLIVDWFAAGGCLITYYDLAKPESRDE
jgi:hypothetical protein